MNVNDLKPAILLVLILGVAACESPMNRAYTVDGSRNQNFDTDLASCKQVAQNYRNPNGQKNRITGALVGGAAGALDAEDGDKLETAAAGAAIGTLVGHLETKSQLSEMQRDVVIRCLQNRGHSVVG